MEQVASAKDGQGHESSYSACGTAREAQVAPGNALVGAGFMGVYVTRVDRAYALSAILLAAWGVIFAFLAAFGHAETSRWFVLFALTFVVNALARAAAGGRVSGG